MINIIFERKRKWFLPCKILRIKACNIYERCVNVYCKSVMCVVVLAFEPLLLMTLNLVIVRTTYN